MGLSVALSELLMQKQLQTEYSYMLMMANDRRMTISDKLSEEISDYNDLQEYENQCIQLDFESDTKDLDTSSDE
ncbi:hypothetical protein IKA92_03655, partial [bacterium]|nr:hypothetical protein [bacterium]